MERLELRILPTTLTTTTDDGMYVEGLVNETEKLSHVLGIRKKFREKISKGAFKKAIDRENRIDFLAEHDNRMLLATTQNGSLDIFEDEQGLKIRAKIAPTSYGKDIYTLMKEGMVGHMSFGFKALAEKWNKGEDGILVRTVEDLSLFEVSAVRNPAYPQSAISARGIEVVEDVEIPEDIENGEVREMENVKTENTNEEIKEVEQVSVEDFRSLMDICKDLVSEVRELKEKLEEQKQDVQDVKEVQEQEVQEQKQEESDKKDEEVAEVEVKEEKAEEKTEQQEERSVDLSSYIERIKKLGVKGE